MNNFDKFSCFVRVREYGRQTCLQIVRLAPRMLVHIVIEAPSHAH